MFSDYLEKLSRDFKVPIGKQYQYVCPFFVVKVRPLLKNL